MEDEIGGALCFRVRVWVRSPLKMEGESAVSSGLSDGGRVLPRGGHVVDPNFLVVWSMQLKKKFLPKFRCFICVDIFRVTNICSNVSRACSVKIYFSLCNVRFCMQAVAECLWMWQLEYSCAVLYVVVTIQAFELPYTKRPFWTDLCCISLWESLTCVAVIVNKVDSPFSIYDAFVQLFVSYMVCHPDVS